MKHFGLILLVILLAVPTCAADDFSLGLGFGYLHSGLGANIALRNDQRMIYLAAGGQEGFFSDEDPDTAFGISGGWIQAHDILGQHGIGFNVGLAMMEAHKGLLFGGPTYTFFYNGIGNPGFTIKSFNWQLAVDTGTAGRI